MHIKEFTINYGALAFFILSLIALYNGVSVWVPVLVAVSHLKVSHTFKRKKG